MKVLRLLFLVAVATAEFSLDFEDIEGEPHEQIEEVVDRCLLENDLDESALAGHQDRIQTRQEIRCYHYCVFKGLGQVDERGNFNFTDVFLERSAQSERKMLEACQDSQEDTNNFCEKGYLFYQCMYELSVQLLAKNDSNANVETDEEDDEKPDVEIFEEPDVEIFEEPDVETFEEPDVKTYAKSDAKTEL